MGGGGGDGIPSMIKLGISELISFKNVQEVSTGVTAVVDYLLYVTILVVAYHLHVPWEPI